MGSSPTEPTRPWLARGVWGLIATVPPNRDLIARGLKNAKFNHTGSSLMTFKEKGEGRIEETRAESQWIVAARPLCHLQYPVAYLSRLQRILPIARWKLRYKATPATHPSRGLCKRHVPLGAKRPLLLVGNRAIGACVASSPDSDLEAFSHNPAHGSFAPLAFQPSAMTNCANQRFLSY